MTEVIKLLAIDDRPDMLTALRAAVRDTLLQTIVLTATDGLAGFALAAEDPDVILLGIDMPGMDSFEVCRRLKADERLSEIPVVFVTDRNTDVASRVKALEVGAEGFLAHPLEPAGLTAQIRAMVKVKAANRRQRLEKEQLEALVAERTQALHEGDERFRVAQELSPDGFTILHPLRNAKGEIVDFTWVYENQAIARINGTDPEEVIGERLLDLFPTHAGTALWEAYTRVADTGQPQTIEEVYVGEIVSRSTWLRLIVISIGEDIAILAHDITDRKRAEEERKKSEDRLKAAERMAHLGSWELDLVTNVLTWSDEIYRIFEIDPAQFGASYEAFLNAIHPDDRDAVSQAYSSSLETRTDYEIDHRLLMPDGRVKHVHEHCITLYDANGRAVRSVGTVHDITERKQAEEALRRSQQEYRSMLQSVQVGVVVHAPDTSILFSNPRASQLLGLTPDQLRGKTAIDKAWCFIREDETPMPLEEYPVNQVLATNQPLTDLTLGILRPDREGPTWVQCNAHPDWGIDGKLQRVVVSFVDITDRKQAETALRKAMAQREMLARHVPGVIYQYRLRPDGISHFPYASQGIEDIYGVTPEQVVDDASLVFAVLHPDDIARVSETIQASARTLKVWRDEYRVNLPNGKTIWVEGEASPEALADGSVLWHGHIRDITDRKQVEEERARLSAEVRAQARQMTQILATVPAGVLLLDAAGQVLQANTVAALDLATLAGVTVGGKLTHLGNRPLAELLTSPPTRGVWHEVKAEGRTFEVIARPVDNDPEPELWVLAINDVTREREIQAQLQQQAQLAVVGQLAAGIAHDFNNIMAVIVLYAEMGMSMADVPPKLRERLQVILQQANRATDLIPSHRTLCESRVLFE